MAKSHSKTNMLPRREHFGWFALGIFALALVVRAVHLWQIHTAPFFALPMGDAQIYDAWARQIAKGDWLGDAVFYHPPLYAYFLAALYRIFGSDVLVVRICQSIIGSLSCVLLACAGRRFFSKAAGIAAGLMLALYAPAIFFDGLFHKTVMAAFFLCLALWLLSGLIAEPRKYSSWLLVGLVIGCMVLTRENALVFAVGIVLWLLLHYRSMGRQRLVFAAMFLVGLAVVLFPVAMRNRIIGGEFHLTTSNFGRNLYIGNNADADGFYRPLRYGRGHPKYELADDTELAEQAMGRELTPAEVSTYWAGRALDYITSHPGDWLRLMARKFLLLWNAIELADTEDQYTYADRSISLRLTGFVCHFGVIGPLALFGVWVTWHKRDKLWLLYLMPAIYAAGVLMFYVFGRYRYPMVPFLVLFASAALVEMFRFLRANSARQIVGCIAATIAMAVFCNWPTIPKDTMQAMTHNNIGNELVLQGKVAEAINCYRQAVQAWPDYVSAHNNLGLALESQGKLDEAVSHYRQALRLKPDHAEAHKNLGRALSTQGKLNEAISHYRQALWLAPDDAETQHNLGNMLKSQGKLNEAVKHYRQTLRLKPDNAEAHYNLGNMLKSQGKLDEAIDHYRQALRFRPDDADMHNNLGNTLGLQGKLDDAISSYRQALHIMPDYAPAHNNLGNALIRTGQLDEALKHFREASHLEPDWPSPLNGIAWILATHPDPKLRDASGAVGLAERAAELTRYQNATILDTLATSYASAGQFNRAAAIAQTALELASAAGDDKLANHIRKRLELYNRQVKENQRKIPREEGEETNKLIKEMQRIDKTYHKELMQYYPLGYTLFAIKDEEEIITLNKNQSRQRCEIDWDTAEIIDLSDKHINIKFASLYDNKTGNILISPNLFVPRKIGVVHRAFKIENLSIVTESLVDSNEGVICLLGLKEDKQE